MLLAPSVTNAQARSVTMRFDHHTTLIAATIASLAPAAGYASNQLLRRLGIEQCAAAGDIRPQLRHRAPLRGAGGTLASTPGWARSL